MKRQEFWNGIPVLDDDTPTDALMGYGNGGLVERDFAADPPEMFAHPSEMDLIPDADHDAYIGEQDRAESSLVHVYRRGGWPWLRQGRWGYCWAHSVTHAVMIARERDHQPFEPLSAFAVAATVKRGRDEGGWCGLSAKFARERGIPSQRAWPQGDADYRKYDRPDVWADAARFRVTEEWVDLAAPVYSQALTARQVDTCLLLNTPVAIDLMWWRHSVCALAKVRVEAGSYGTAVLNSWPDAGLQILRGSRRIPDGAVAVRAVRAAA